MKKFSKIEPIRNNQISIKLGYLKYLVYPLFFLPYLGTGIPAYLFAFLFIVLNLDSLKFKWMDVLILSAILIWFIFKLQQSQAQSVVILLRYYFGFYIFYLFFNSIKIDLNIEKLLLLLCILIIIEAVLINTVIPLGWLPNYPAPKGNAASFETKILGFYQRPYSIGNNASISATIVVLILFYLKAMHIKTSVFTKIVSNTAVILIASGEGYMLLLLYYIFLIQPFKNIIRLSISLSFLSLMFFSIFIADIGVQKGLERISAAYIDFLYTYKSFQVENVRYSLNQAPYGIFIGYNFRDPSELIIWSDFAWNDMYYCTGAFGVGILVFTLIMKFNKYNGIPLLIFAISALHYGAMFSLPGQLLLGYFFSKKIQEKNSVNYYVNRQLTFS